MARTVISLLSSSLLYSMVNEHRVPRFRRSMPQPDMFMYTAGLALHVADGKGYSRSSS